MANPLIDFIDLVDQYGTRVGELSVQLDGGVMSLLWEMGAEFVTAVAQLVLVYAIFIVDLIINQGLFLEIAGSMYQIVLDTVYAIVNPLIIATLAFAVLIARMYIGDKVTRDKTTGRINSYALNYQDLSDESFRKKVGNQLGNTAILMLVIIVAMANPFTLLVKAFQLINQFVAQIAPGGVGASPQVDGVLVPVLQLINFQSQLAPACTREWSLTLASGGDVTDLACLTPEQQAATSPGVTTFLMSVMAIVIVVGFAYFAWVILCRFTWMLFRMIIHIAVLPWDAAMLIANPGDEREKLETVKDHLVEAAKSLFWLMVSVFVALVVPALIFNAMGAATRSGLPLILQLPIASGLFYGAAKLVNRYVGRKWRTNKDGSKSPETDGTSGWNDFVLNSEFGKTLSEAFTQAQKESSAELARSAAVIVGTQPTAGIRRGAREGSAVTNEPVENPALDEAVHTVKIESPRPTAAIVLSAEKGAIHDPVTPEKGTAASSEHELVNTAVTDSAPAATVSVLPGSALRDGHVALSEDPSNRVGLHGGEVSSGESGRVGGGHHVASATDNPEVRQDLSTMLDEQSGTADECVREPEDSERARRKLIDEYMGAIEQIAEVPDDSPSQQLTPPSGRAGEAAAFHRITKVYDEPITDPQRTAGLGVTAGSGEFLSCTQRRVEFDERRILAESIGMRVQHEGDEQSTRVPEITFYRSSEDGNNEVRIRGRDGFGDGI
ncbi:hypothetical protein [Rhodococcus pyridinivorans]|uniref:hypothetical protein n=1 Tax=Rhodococcus pyridinivorans TaxID=103816 RepID=UPI0026594074|nr:hypothetical protein [Rhodococcus pyridinivorans]